MEWNGIQYVSTCCNESINIPNHQSTLFVYRSICLETNNLVDTIQIFGLKTFYYSVRKRKYNPELMLSICIELVVSEAFVITNKLKF